jgi:hypothetical protein
MSSFRKLWQNSSRPLIAVSALMLLGCGESVSPGRGVPVSGTITMGGEPLEGANVYFLNGTFAGFARTDAAGKYRLVQGALPGTNKIVISKIEGGAEPVVNDPESGMDAGQMEAAAMGSGTEVKKPKNLVPDEYGDATRTKLTFDVPTAGADGVDFNI